MWIEMRMNLLINMEIYWHMRDEVEMANVGRIFDTVECFMCQFVELKKNFIFSHFGNIF